MYNLLYLTKVYANVPFWLNKNNKYALWDTHKKKLPKCRVLKMTLEMTQSHKILKKNN